MPLKLVDCRLDACLNCRFGHILGVDCRFEHFSQTFELSLGDVKLIFGLFDPHFN